MRVLSRAHKNTYEDTADFLIYPSAVLSHTAGWGRDLIECVRACVNLKCVIVSVVILWLLFFFAGVAKQKGKYYFSE